MDALKRIIETLGIPQSIGLALLLIYCLLQLIGELVELRGKIVPEFFKIRKFFQRRKRERAETQALLLEVKSLLDDVHSHYSEDNIQRRDDWMSAVNNDRTWVHEQAQCYDQAIEGIKDTLREAKTSMDLNTAMVERMFIESSRDRIIDFAEKVADPMRLVSREEFNRIFKVYDAYEVFLEERGLTNGEVEVAHDIIVEAYEDHLRNHTFIENRREKN